MLDAETIARFPKVELHCHLDGSIRPQTLQKIAARQQLPIEQNLTLLQKQMQVAPDCQSLDDYLTCFEVVLPYLQTVEALEMAAFDVMEQAYEDGVCYLELRFAPTLSQRKGLSLEAVISAVCSGVIAAEKKYPIHGNVLICGMRTDTAAAVEEVITNWQTQAHPKAVGFDLAGPEKDHFIRDYQPALNTLNEQAQHLTLHAGECGCAHNIVEALAAGATRIGHGIALKEAPTIRQQLKAHSFLIEACPTSNVQTQAISSLAEYPFRLFLEEELAFCLNTDNRTVSGTTLTKEYQQAVTHFAMTAAEFYHLNEQALQFSFAPAELKKELQEKMRLAQH